MAHSYPGVYDFTGMMLSGYGRTIGWLFGQIATRSQRLVEISEMFPDAPSDVIRDAYSFALASRTAARNLAAGRSFAPPSPARYGGPPATGTYTYDLLVPLTGPGSDTGGPLRVILNDSDLLDLSQIRNKISLLAQSEIERVTGRSPGALKGTQVADSPPEVFAVYLQ